MGKKRTGVEARGDSIRIAFPWEGKRHRETLRIPPTPKNLQFAANKRGQILTEIAMGQFDLGTHFPDSPKAKRDARTVSSTLSTWVRTWISTSTASESTLTSYGSYAVEHVHSKSIGHRPIAEITASELLIWRAELGHAVSPKTANNVMIVMRGALRLAHADNAIKDDLGSRLKNMKVPRITHADPFTPTELAALQGVVDGGHRNMVQLWWSSGMRHGEIYALKWIDIDWASGRAHVRRTIVKGKLKAPKDNEERFVRLGSTALEALRAQHALTGDQTEWVFINPDTGAPWRTHRELHAKFGRWCRAAGVRARPPKQLRHTYASLALSAGEPMLFVRDQLGHSSLKMLEQTYAKWIPAANPTVGRGFDAIASTVSAPAPSTPVEASNTCATLSAIAA